MDHSIVYAPVHELGPRHLRPARGGGEYSVLSLKGFARAMGYELGYLRYGSINSMCFLFVMCLSLCVLLM